MDKQNSVNGLDQDDLLLNEENQIVSEPTSINENTVNSEAVLDDQQLDLEEVLALEDEVFDLDIATAAGEQSDGGSSSAVSLNREGAESIASTDFSTASFTLASAPTPEFDDEQFVNNTDSDQPLTVQLTDNFVNGVNYTTSSGLSGTTGESGVAGEFNYYPGDTITLTVGDVVVAEFSADVIQGDILFLQDIAGTDLSDSNSQYVENMAIFLQALDSDLTDSDTSDTTLQTNLIVNSEDSYATNINISDAVHEALTGYIDATTNDQLYLSESGKEMLSQVLAAAGVEFTRETELDESGEGNNVFESIAMDHVADTVQDLAGERTPDSADEREADSIDVPGGLITFNFNEAEGVITFSSDDLLAGAEGQQVVTENLVVDNVELAAGFTDIGELVDNGDGQYSIILNDDVTGKDLEGLAIDYRVEDWTVSQQVTSETLDLYKSHLSADIESVNESDEYNQFTLNSSLTFEEDSALTINFTSELLSEQLTDQLLAELTALGIEPDFDGDVLNIAEYADDYTVPIEYSNDGGVTWTEMTVVDIDTSGDIPRPIFGFELEAGNSSVEIRIAIFDDSIVESTEYFRAEVSGDNFYDETLVFAIEDNDTTVSNDLPSIDIDYVLVTEGEGEAVFTLTLSEASTETVTVEYSTQELSALFGEDFEAVEGVVTFLPGETEATISIPIIDDFIAEDSPEFALVNLSNATNAVIDDGQGTLRIFDNDLPVDITVSNGQIAEGETATFTVELDKDADISSFVLLNLTLTADGADLTDYDPDSISAFYGDASSPQYLEFDNSGNVIIPVDVDSITVVIDTLDDAIVEDVEQLILTATIADNSASGSVDIVDNDFAPEVDDQEISYSENQLAGSVVGTVVSGDAVASYLFDNGTKLSDDGYYSINDLGEITITDLGANSELNNFELGRNSQEYSVIASDEHGNDSSFVITMGPTDIDDLTTLTLTAGTATEDVTEAGDVVATFTVSDEDATASVNFTDGTNDDGYYAIDGTNIVLAGAGEAYLDAGNELPEISLTTSGTSTDITATDTPTTVLTDDATVLTLTAGTVIEDVTNAGSIVGTFNIVDEDDVVSVDFTSGSNDNGYYAIDGNNIILTDAGEAYLDAGNELPTISLTTSGSTTEVTESATPVTLMGDDNTVLVLTAGTVTEGVTNAGETVASFAVSDEDETASVDFTSGTNTNGYYEIDGTNIVLTDAGEAYLDAGNELPEISLTTSGTSTDVTATDTPTTVLTDDATLLTLTAGTATEDVTEAGDTVATFTVSDEDETATVDFTDGTNDDGYYEIDGTNIVLTDAGEAYLDAGNELPEISLTTSGTSTDVTATDTPATVLTDDATVLTLTAGTVTEDVTEAGDTVATFSVSDEDETASVDFTSGTNTNGYYAISGTTIILTAVGEAYLDAGNELPEISLTTSGTSTDVTATDTPTTVLTDDATVLTLTAGSATEDVTEAGDTVATFTVSDEDETASVDFTSGTNTNGYYAISGTTIILTAVGEAYLDAGNELPEISLTTSGTSTDVTATDTPTTVLTDDATVLTLTAGSATEDVTEAGDTVATFTVSDEDETASVDFTSGTNTNGYYEIDGTNIVLTDAGEAYLDAGNELPEISLTTSGTSTDVTATDTPTTVLTDDATVLTLTAGTVTEDVTEAGDTVATFSVSDEDETASVDFTSGTNTNGYYAISGTTIILTAAGKAYLDAGNELPEISLTTSGTSTDVTATDTPTTVLTDDATVLTLTAGTVTEDVTEAGDTVATFSVSDEDETASVDFTSGTNTNGYYAISGTTIILTAAGEAYLDAGNELPEISLTTSGTSTDVNATDTPTTVLTDDATVLTLTAGTATEDVTEAGDTVATFTVSDEDETASVDFTDGTNDDGYYEIDGTNIVLTDAGEAFLDAGNELPEISLTTSGTSTDVTATDTPITVLTDDATILTLTAGTVTEDVTEAGDTVATFSVSDEDETASVDFTSGTNTNGYYEIDGTTIILTAAGEAYLDAGNELPEISLTTSGTSTNVTATDTPTTVLTDDATMLTLTAGTATEDVTEAGDTVATFTVSDEDETASVDFTSGTNTNGYYEIDGTNIVLTDAGEAYLDAGNELPEISLTTSGTSTDVTATDTPTTVLTDDATILTLTAGTVTEDVTEAGDTVATFTVSDEDETASVDFTSGTNTNGYYAISGSTIILTAAGEVYLDAGNELPGISLTTSGTSTDVTATDTPTTVLTDDATILTLTAGTVTEDVTEAGDTVATFTVSDEDETASVDFTDGTNDDGYYEIDGTNIVLTNAGEAYLDAGNELPEISLTTSGTSTDVTATDTPTTMLTDDPTLLTLMALQVVEGTTVAGDTLAVFNVSDQDEAVTVDFTPGSNDDGYYAISYSSIILTAAGQAYLEAGNELPEISLTTSGTSTDVTATDTPTTILINDAPIAVDDVNAVVEGNLLTVNAADGLLSNDSDEEGDSISAIEFAASDPGDGNSGTVVNGSNTITTALGGTVTLNADGSYTYNAPAYSHQEGEANPVDSFVYKVSDGSTDSDWATVTIELSDSSPVAIDDTDSVGYGGITAGNVITGEATQDSDNDGVGDGQDNLGADNTQITSISYTDPESGVTTLYDTDSAEFDGNSWTISANSGELIIDQNGEYTFESSQAPDSVDISGSDLLTIATGFESGESFLDGDGNLNLAGLDNSDVEFRNNRGLYVDSPGGADDGDELDNSDDGEKEAIVLSLADSVNSVTVTVADMDGNDDGIWQLFNSDGELVDSGSFGDFSGNNSTQTLTISSAEEFSYIVFTGGNDDNDDYNIWGISYSVEPELVDDETFTYTLEDEDGSVSSADLTVVHETTIIGVDDTGYVYEAGLDTGTDAGNSVTVATGNLLDNDAGIGANAVITEITDGNESDSSPDSNGVLTIDTENGELVVYTEDYNGERAGYYEYTLTSNSLDGDSAVNEITYTVSDGDTSDTGTLTINIVDDSPSGTTAEETLSSQAQANNTNLILVLDTSGSMAYDWHGDGLDYLAIAVEALTALIEQADDAGNVNVQIVAFSNSDNTNASSWFVDDVEGAIAYLETLVADGGTHYDDALNAVIGADSAPADADNTLLYFVSDGIPNSDHDVDNTVSYDGENGVTAWQNYVTDNIDVAYGIGIGSGTSLEHLEDVAYPNTDANNDSTDDYAFILEDPNDLAVSLLETFASNVVVGDLGILGAASSTGFMIGADDGVITAITINDVTYSYSEVDGISGTDGTSIDSSDLILTTDLGATFEFNFETGAYFYSIDLDSNVLGEQEIFTVDVEDLDGDQHSLNLVINVDYEVAVDANRDTLITNVSDGTTIEIPALALMWNDAQGDGGNAVISSVENISADLSVVYNDNVELTVDANNEDDDSFDYSIESSITDGSTVSDTTTVDVQTETASDITGDDSSEILIGNTADNTLTGNEGDDVLIGGEGDDTLIGGQGNDLLIGGEGIDTFVWAEGETGTDTLVEFEVSDGDRLDLSDLFSVDVGGGYELDDYLNITSSDTQTIIEVFVDGDATDANATAEQTIVLDDVDLGSMDLTVVNSAYDLSDPDAVLPTLIVDDSSITDTTTFTVAVEDDV